MRKFLLTVGLLAVMAVLAVGFASAQDGGSGASGAGYPVDTISVTGTGSASGTPDIANVEIGVRIQNESISVAFSQANTTLSGVIDAIVSAGVAREDIRTTGLDVYQQERFDGPPMPSESGMAQNGEQPQYQYNVTNRVRVIVRDIALVESVLESAVEAGANQIFGLNFGIEDQDALIQEARLAAVETARNNAEQLAAAVGAELGEVLVISEGQGGGFDPFNVRNMAEAAQGGGLGGATIEPGQLNVTVTVNITYRLVR